MSVKSVTILIGLFLFSRIISHAQIASYGVAETPWKEELGNHRAVIHVKAETDAVQVIIPWRRRDLQPEDKQLIVTDAAGREVRNIYRIHVNKELGEFVFQPTSGADIYYMYYMPYKGKKNIGWWEGNYLNREDAPDSGWVQKNKLGHLSNEDKLEKAELLKIESRTAFDSFYPMEVCATIAEVNTLISSNEDSYLLFPEERKYPIRMTTDLPYRWIQNKPAHEFKATAMRNEYYVFQVGVYAAKKDLKDITISFEGSDKVTCFNTGGIDAEGKPFTKRVDLAKGNVQALWFGVDIDKNQKTGEYAFDIIITPENEKPQTVHVKLDIEYKVLTDRGDSEPWRHSRLRWLNSTLGIDNNAVSPYTPLQVKDKSIKNLLHQVKLNANGFPDAITANGHAFLNGPLRFIVETNNGIELIKFFSFNFIKESAGKVEWVAKGESEKFSIAVRGTMEFDGTVRYDVELKSTMNVAIKDIRLELPVKKQLAQYFMGMGLPGGYCPSSYNWKWDDPVDSYWIGSVVGGLHCEMRGATYSGPLLNLYHPAPPANWYNANKGGFTIHSSTNETVATTYSGERNLQAGEKANFQFDLLITPVKKLNPRDQFDNRYYHNGSQPSPSPGDLASGIKITNVHHANPVNPYINYPFIAVDTMKHFVNHWHKQGLKVKIYYTIRELTNQTPEIWALRSLGTEVLSGGKGGGYPWLREHFVDNYDVQWFTPISGYEACDAAVLTSGKSRWYNYYVEGLRWLVQHMGIDGLYLDDVAFDRQMLSRMRKVMNSVKPGCLLDLHSNTGFSKGPANQYTEFFPFIDKLWFGESFNYNKMSADNWLVEVSGIPFGLMGDMLHAGGNAWRGMVYGMTVRYPWFTEGVSCDPRDIWKVWDEFEIDKAKMIGYWDQQCPVKTTNPSVLATAYVQKGKTLVSIASWSPSPVDVQLDVDWKAIGIDPAKARFALPAIKNFQEGRTMHINKKIQVLPAKGLLIIIQ